MGYVIPRPLIRPDASVDCSIFRRQPKRIPAHGMEHVVSPRPLVTGDYVPDGVVPHVAYMEFP